MTIAILFTAACQNCGALVQVDRETIDEINTLRARVAGLEAQAGRMRSDLEMAVDAIDKGTIQTSRVAATLIRKILAASSPPGEWEAMQAVERAAREYAAMAPPRGHVAEPRRLEVMRDAIAALDALRRGGK